MVLLSVVGLSRLISDTKILFQATLAHMPRDVDFMLPWMKQLEW